MFARKFVTINLVVHVIIAFSYVDVAHAVGCPRIPDGSGARRSPSTGNFRIRFSDDSGVYKPGKQYTIFLERTNNKKVTFHGFFLAVEQKSNITSTYAEDFSEDRHGVFKKGEDNSLVKLICGNVVTHTSDTAKNEIFINWTAPKRGSGCVTFRATVIEHRDVWYMDDGPLSKDFCEDEDTQDDYLSIIVESCRACSEAKYELTFEGLWSRNTHPKDFPRNVYTTKFGDIIGATHAVGNGFWAPNEFASEGLKEVAEIGFTRTLEAELKNKSTDIRTIIKARGLSYPNITGKTFAVFRVDPEHHLVSFVTKISPSPDWFVGVTSLELCQFDGTWLESKIVDLYPWDAGTDNGVTYDAIDQPTMPQEYIRRITSESPTNPDAPFYSPSGSKMKPLARLTLLRQRLYEKNCTAEQSASDDCQVGEYSAWGECTGTVCGGTGKQYRQRYYKSPDKATKCHRKLFETKTCIMPRCTHEDGENVPSDSECDSKSYYSDWSSCNPNCKRSEDEKGKHMKFLKYAKGSFKTCSGRGSRPKVIEEECEIERWCSKQNQVDSYTTESTDADGQTDAPAEEEQSTTPKVDCTYAIYSRAYEYGPCEGTCGTGKRTRTQNAISPKYCEPIVDLEDCILQTPCLNKDFCNYLPDEGNCHKSEKPTNYIFYNATECTCTVFNTFCEKEDDRNIFSSFDECTTACPRDENNCRYQHPNRARKP